MAVQQETDYEGLVRRAVNRFTFLSRTPELLNVLGLIRLTESARAVLNEALVRVATRERDELEG